MHVKADDTQQDSIPFAKQNEAQTQGVEISTSARTGYKSSLCLTDHTSAAMQTKADANQQTSTPIVNQTEAQTQGAAISAKCQNGGNELNVPD